MIFKIPWLAMLVRFPRGLFVLFLKVDATIGVLLDGLYSPHVSLGGIYSLDNNISAAFFPLYSNTTQPEYEEEKV